MLVVRRTEVKLASESVDVGRVHGIARRRHHKITSVGRISVCTTRRNLPLTENTAVVIEEVRPGKLRRREGTFCPLDRLEIQGFEFITALSSRSLYLRARVPRQQGIPLKCAISNIQTNGEQPTRDDVVRCLLVTQIILPLAGWGVAVTTPVLALTPLVGIIRSRIKTKLGISNIKQVTILKAKASVWLGFSRINIETILYEHRSSTS